MTPKIITHRERVPLPLNGLAGAVVASCRNGRGPREELVVFGAAVGLTLASLEPNIYVQIGLVMLIGLVSKNAILIVEFASEKRRQGFSILESASEAAKLRFRAILMTAFSSILGFNGPSIT